MRNATTGTTPQQVAAGVDAEDGSLRGVAERQREKIFDLLRERAFFAAPFGCQTVALGLYTYQKEISTPSRLGGIGCIAIGTAFVAWGLLRSFQARAADAVGERRSQA